MYKIEFHAMGCQMLAGVDSNTDRAGQLIKQVPVWFEEWEQCLSRFREDSELSRLNRGTGHAVAVSSVLWHVLELALKAADDTDGLVSPTLLNELERAGYDHSLERIVPANARLTAHRNPLRTAPRPDWQRIEVYRRTHAVLLPPGVRLDFGGIAKGWAAQEAMQRLAEEGPALVDAGGDIAISGPRADGNPWFIAVANPANMDNLALPLLAVNQGGIATSGRDYRRWQQDGVWQHHIIDPRTGQPAVTDVLTATVIAPALTQAEVGAKVALILGSRAGLEWLDGEPDLAGLVIRDEGEIESNSRMGQYIWS